MRFLCRFAGMLAVAALLATAAAAAAQKPFVSAKGKPNVVFIVVDDLNTDLGVYGHPHVKTPNLDKLAARGVRFERAYAQYPMCNPSRLSFLSGKRPETIGIFDNRSPVRARHPDIVMLPQLFRQQGYFSARIGKVFHDELYDLKVNADDPLSWDMTVNPRGTPRHLEGEGKNLTGGRVGYLNILASEGSDADQPDGEAAAEAVRLLERRAAAASSNDQPFFLALGLRKPHNPYYAPKKYFELFSLNDAKPNRGPTNDGAAVPPMVLPPAANASLGEKEGREFVRAYWACNTFMDAQVGVVLEALERLKLGDNTIVVFFSDHGLHLGEHNWWNKVTLFERSARVPLIIAGPGVGARGKVSTRTVELLDLFPTLVALAGLRAPSGLEGKSLAPLLSDAQAPWDKAAFTVVSRGGGGKMGRTVRTERFRYTEWDEGRLGAELYDHQSDPNEWTNLAPKPEQASIVAELKRLLQTSKTAVAP